MRRALIVDWGGVLTAPIAHAMQRWAAEEGLPYAETMAILDWYAPQPGEDHMMHALERGEIDAQGIANWLSDELHEHYGIAISPDGLIQRMFDHFEPHDEILNLCREARNSGWVTALLSNSWDNPYPRERWDNAFDAVLISGEIGMRKPEERIFLHALDVLGVEAAHAVFIDDEEPNIIAARELGITAIFAQDQHVAAAELRMILQA